MAGRCCSPRTGARISVVSLLPVSAILAVLSVTSARSVNAAEEARTAAASCSDTGATHSRRTAVEVFNSGDFSHAMKVLQECLQQCEATLSADARAGLLSDLALLQSKQAEYDACLATLDRASSLPVSPKLAGALAFNRGLCGGSCTGAPSACEAGSKARRLRLAAQAQMDKLCSKRADMVEPVSVSGDRIDMESPYHTTETDPARVVAVTDLNGDGRRDLILYVGNMGPDVDNPDNPVHVALASCGKGRYLEVLETVSDILEPVKKRTNGWLDLSRGHYFNGDRYTYGPRGKVRDKPVTPPRSRRK